MKDFTPTASALNELLVKNRVKDVKITKLKQVELAKPGAAFELAISGLT